MADGAAHTLPSRALAQEPAPKMDPISALLASATPGDPHFTDALNEAIREAPADTIEERTALGQRLLAMLEAGRLETLRGTDEEPAAVVAAARVLELGFPWALHLSPEQLAQVRALRTAEPPRPRGLAFVCSAISTGMTVTCVLAAGLPALVGEHDFWRVLYALSLVGMLALNGGFALGRLPRWIAAGVSSGLLVLFWLVADWLPLPCGGDLGLLATVAPFFWAALAAAVPPRRAQR